MSSTFILPLIGSTRPPRRTNRALPEARASNVAAAILEQDEPVTTARPPAQTAATIGTTTEAPASTTSVMRDWVNELTGSGDRTNAGGLRVPAESEITQIAAMFPNVGRDTVVGALQRRYVVFHVATAGSHFAHSISAQTQSLQSRPY